MWSKILREFSENPRDVHTIPKVKKEPMWFFVYEDFPSTVDNACDIPYHSYKRILLSTIYKFISAKIPYQYTDIQLLFVAK